MVMLIVDLIQQPTMSPGASCIEYLLETIVLHRIAVFPTQNTYPYVLIFISFLVLL